MQSSNHSMRARLQRFFAAERTRRTALQFIQTGIGSIAVWAAFRVRARATAASGGAQYPSLYSDPEPFPDAISRERVGPSAPLAVTGISVPHDLLAADLIARGFWAAHGGKFERVVIFSPGPFQQKHGPTRYDAQGF